MGSFIEVNDTLRISKAQGFPELLDIGTHQKTPYTLADVEKQTFRFSAKPKIRLYKIPPVRNFLVEDLGGKWLYWGLCNILHIEHDYQKQETSGVFTIIHLNTVEEMKQAFQLIDQRPEYDYFASK